MKNKIGMKEMASAMNAVTHWESLSGYFTQLKTGEDKNKLVEFWNTNVVKRDTSTYMTQAEYDQWCEINLHIVSQMWGNTSGGWETIGGSAMTSAYTTIIENNFYGLAAVFYNGQLAYICQIDDKWKVYSEGFRFLPGMSDCSRKLTIIYKK
jgi:predicted phage tail protein